MENNTAPTTKELTYIEWNSKSFGSAWRISKILESKSTEFQHMELFDTKEEGKLLVFDGAVMLTERFESHYHDMLVHPALITHPNPKRVLIVGGGDGGSIRETVRHPELEKVIQYEIDPDVYELARKHLPSLTSELDNPKVQALVDDGIEAVQNAKSGYYDVILIDSTDPVGPAVELFEEGFYHSVYEALAPDGIMATQVTDYAYHPDHLVKVVNRLRKIFPVVRPYNSHIPMYPSGVWSFALASKKYDPLEKLDASRVAKLEEKCEYWNYDIHKACFAFPNKIKRMLEGKA